LSVRESRVVERFLAKHRACLVSFQRSKTKIPSGSGTCCVTSLPSRYSVRSLFTDMADYENRPRLSEVTRSVASGKKNHVPHSLGTSIAESGCTRTPAEKSSKVRTSYQEVDS
jgi:hypothetical protein